MTITTSTGPRPSDKWIPFYIFGFFALLVSVLVPMCIIAVRTSPGLVTESSYEKGLAYNRNIKLAAEQQALHWHSDLRAIPIADGKITAEFALTDKDKAPLDKADVTVKFVRPAEKGLDQKMVMQGHGNGHYSVTLDLPKKGVWDMQLSAMLDGHNYQTSQRIIVP